MKGDSKVGTCGHNDCLEACRINLFQRATLDDEFEIKLGTYLLGVTLSTVRFVVRGMMWETPISVTFSINKSLLAAFVSFICHKLIYLWQTNG